MTASYAHPESLVSTDWLAAHIDHGDGGISEIFRRRFPTNNRHAMHRRQQGAGKQFIFMSAAGMSEDERKHEERRSKRKPMALA